MNRAELISILKKFAQQIGDQHIRWAVGSSAALLLHGFDVDPSDIDIITDELGAHYLNDILNNCCIDPIKKRGDSKQFDSLLGSFTINGYCIEIMGNFRFKSCNDQLWYCFDDMFDLVEQIVIDNVEIPVVSLNGLIDIYQKMGRKKDLAKLALIQRKDEACCGV